MSDTALHDQEPTPTYEPEPLFPFGLLCILTLIGMVLWACAIYVIVEMCFI